MDISDLPKAVCEATGSAFSRKDILLVQECPRAKTGWSSENLQGYRLLSHRPEGVWRGTGIVFHTSTWNMVSRKSSPRGIWVHLRHLASQESLWLSSVHFSPGVTQEIYEAEVEGHFRARPKGAKAIVLQGDLNSGFRWWSERERVEVSARDGKADIFHRYAAEAGLDFVPFRPVQWETPTSRPRQQGRLGTQIDYMLCAGIRRESCEVHEDSYLRVGSDHECLSATFTMKTPRVLQRYNSGPREWTGGVRVIHDMNQGILEGLAHKCTRPKRGESLCGSTRGEEGSPASQAPEDGSLLETGPTTPQTCSARVGSQAPCQGEPGRLGGSPVE